MILFLLNDAPMQSNLLQWSQTLLTGMVSICIVLITLSMLLCIYRLIAGPHLADRALAADTLGVELIGLVILLSMQLETSVYADGILVLSLLGFAGSVAMAQYIARPHLNQYVDHHAQKGPTRARHEGEL